MPLKLNTSLLNLLSMLSGEDLTTSHHQADTFENFVEEEESDGEERQVKEKNHRVIGTMDASESDSEVWNQASKVHQKWHICLSTSTERFSCFNLDKIEL